MVPESDRREQRPEPRHPAGREPMVPYPFHRHQEEILSGSLHQTNRKTPPSTFFDLGASLRH